jgi:cytochrome oxidase assembly protein ShyY1
VEVSGKFDPVREFVVRPRTRDGQNGGLLLTPFRRSDDGYPPTTLAPRV